MLGERIVMGDGADNGDNHIAVLEGCKSSKFGEQERVHKKPTSQRSLGAASRQLEKQRGVIIRTTILPERLISIMT